MGIEYSHHMAVSDPAWLPQSDTPWRVDAVLRRWLLLDKPEERDEPEFYQCERGPWRERCERDVPIETPGSGLALCYRHMRWQATLNIFGSSLYPGGSNEDLYICYITIIVGTDFRVQSHSESTFWFDVSRPARRNGVDIRPYRQQDLAPIGLNDIYGEAFSAGADTTPPIVELHAEPHAHRHIGFGSFPGFWRAALIFDFNKSLHAFTDGKQVIPNRDFVSDVGEAFRGPIAEIGRYS